MHIYFIGPFCTLNVFCTLEGLYFNFRELPPDELSGYTNSYKDPNTTFCFFELGLIGYGFGPMIFHKMSPRTHHNYL